MSDYVWVSTMMLDSALVKLFDADKVKTFGDFLVSALRGRSGTQVILRRQLGALANTIAAPWWGSRRGLSIGVHGR